MKPRILEVRLDVGANTLSTSRPGDVVFRGDKKETKRFLQTVGKVTEKFYVYWNTAEAAGYVQGIGMGDGSFQDHAASPHDSMISNMNGLSKKEAEDLLAHILKIAAIPT